MGNMVRVKVTVRGTRPLLQHYFGMDAIPLEKEERTGVAGNDPENWKKTCMVNDDGELFIHGSYVFGCIRDGAKHVGKKGSGLQDRVTATLQVEEPIILLGRKQPEVPQYNAYTAPVYIDVRGVRNPTTKARNIRYRMACSPGWEATFTLSWDKTVVPREVMRGIVQESSVLVGLGNGRKIGMGRFEVIAWEVLSGAEETPAEGSVGPDAGESLPKGRRKVRAVPETAVADNGEH